MSRSAPPTPRAVSSETPNQLQANSRPCVPRPMRLSAPAVSCLLALLGGRLRGGSASCLSCASLKELSACAAEVNQVCCTNGGCESGAPTTCDAQCEAVLVPMVHTCKTFLDTNYGLIPVSAALGRSVIACKTQNPPRIGGPEPAPSAGPSTPTDFCDSNPCQNGATCASAAGTYACTCSVGYHGENCHTLTDKCSPDPCLNDGACSNSGPGRFRCACSVGYTGEVCGTPTDFCDSNPCQHFGTCASAAGTYACTCSVGYHGENCHTLTDKCSPDPCLNDGACSNSGPGRFRCACSVGYTGWNCSTSIDLCRSYPCQHFGTCASAAGTYSCTCSVGYHGPNCQYTYVTPEVIQLSTATIGAASYHTYELAAILDTKKAKNLCECHSAKIIAIVVWSARSALLWQVRSAAAC
jgi:hypothetical protein